MIINCIRCFIIIFLNKYLLYDIYSVITFSTCNRTMILKIVICSKYKVIELFTRLIWKPDLYVEITTVYK